MSSFVDDVISADAILDEIDDYLNDWHNSNTDATVYEYLGMTEEEYFLWVENDYLLKYIISAHEQSKSITEVLKDVYSPKLVARSSSSAEAKRLYEWLKREGYDK